MTAVYDQDEDQLETHYDVDLDPEQDEPAQHEPVFVDATVREHTDRPVIPASWRGWSNIKATILAGLVHGVHALAFHAVRLPRYLLLLAFWALVGTGKLSWRFLRWVGDPDGRPAADEAVRRDSPDAFRHLRESHDRHVRHRLVGLATGFAVAAVTLLLMWWLAPWWVQALILAVTVPILAKVGKPAHRHIITPAVVTPRVRRLNSDVVIRAYAAAGLTSDKPGQELRFAGPMRRDGAGGSVPVDLPYGRSFTDAIRKREAIASGLDVSVNQVWLTPDATSSRRHQLHVSDRDMLAVPAGRSPLLRLRQVDVWRDPVRFGLDQRGQPVNLDVPWSSFLVGGQPRRGKSYSARLVALHVACDPYTRLIVVDGKAAPDWRGFTKVADQTIFGSVLGHDGDPVEHLAVLLRSLRDDIQQRNRTLSGLRTTDSPDGTLTRELSRSNPRLRFTLVILEEIQEFIDGQDPAVAKEIVSLLSSVAKLGPSVGVAILTSTQKPILGGGESIKTMFTGFRDQHTVRFSLRVGNRHVSEAVLGGDATSEGYDAATIPAGSQYRGVGILAGVGDTPAMVRCYLADRLDADKILTSARRWREAAGTLSGVAAGDDATRVVRDPLADTIRVWGAFVDRPGLHWERLAEVLAAQLPEKYGREDADSVSALLRGLGVESQDVKMGGVNRKGCRRDAVEAALRRRELGGSGSADLVPVTRPGGGSAASG